MILLCILCTFLLVAERGLAISDLQGKKNPIISIKIIIKAVLSVLL